MFKSCFNLNDSMMVEEIYKEKDVQRLRDQLATLKQKRRRLREIQQEVSQHQEQTQQRLDELSLEQQNSIQELESILVEKHAHYEFLELSEQWNVLNDSVHIWHQGPFATIHNCRLGSEVPKHAVGENNNRQQHQPRKQTPTSPPRGGWNLFGSQQVANDPSSPSNANHSNGNHGNHHNHSSIKVAWPEINAALGHVVLLVQMLAQQSQVTLPHTLLPMGAASRIYLNGNAISGTCYNVYFEESSLWGRSNLRNFHIALNGVCDCVFALIGKQTDKTVAVPHPMVFVDKTTNQLAPHWQIGGVALVHFGNAPNNNNNNGQASKHADFTKACKYWLTNLKWLVAYSVKHHAER